MRRRRYIPKPIPREHSLQVAVKHMLDLILDPGEVWWSAIDHGVGKLTRAEAGLRKARGVKAGLPDFMFLPKGRPLLCIEMKTENGQLSWSQIACANDWLAMGSQGIYVARSLEEVQEILEHCCVPLRRRMQFFGSAA